MTRDAVGNLYSYDAENHQTQYFESTNTTTPRAKYFYDGDGRRVKKIVKVQSGQQTVDETTIFVYDGGSALVAEYTINAPASTTPPQTIYLTADVLGSPRINTNQKGEVISRHDYLPFGDEIIGFGLGQRTSEQGYGMPDGVRKKFTGYEKDQETGLDFAQARYYGNGLGRFTSVDPALESIEPTLPQSWNRYIYVLNNPLALTDPTGLCPPSRNCQTDQGGNEFYIEDGVEIYVIEKIILIPPSISEILGSNVTTLPRPTTVPRPPLIWEPPPLTPITPQSQPQTPPEPGVGLKLLPLFRVFTFATVFKAFETPMGCGSMPNGISDGNGGCTKATPKADISTTTTATDTTQDKLDNNLIIVRGGTTDLPPRGTVFSGAYGVTIEDAATYVPHGQIRFTTVKAIIESGGSVIPIPEMTRGGNMNYRHVNIVEGKTSTFSPLIPNPVPAKLRIK
jgi:RHS repeat-associated protein